jgi:hypothetical protein
MIIGAAFLAALCLSWWARGVASPSELESPAPPTTAGVVGFPNQVDPIASLDLARTLTKRADLRGITATGVRSDGTVDVTGPGHLINYSFSSARGEGPQPPRPPGTLPKHAFCGKQTVHVRPEGMGADPDLVGLPCTPSPEPLPTPRCGPKQVWQSAIKHGAPTDLLATVEYFRSVTGPAWRFTVNGQKPMVFYGDCERELVGAETAVAGP